ncbi:hypothetical protein EV356DRAFT_98225 [Viridothelium virens]|uniref:Glucose-methanol-choline oxidoreductase N-terminal domain-containing protein n=1 Tax=Viridothelium virens TaxID=1048519 RepID=A0A6A6HCI1_VIRVR|nr:hypothetical protein EV356DRAFT_98225 [Viridothelium virens]
MKLANTLLNVSLLVGLWATSAYAQAAIDSFIDPSSGIPFSRASVDSSETAGGFQFGVALPNGTDSQAEYLGYLVGARTSGAGWTGISHAGPMTSSLLLLAWVDGQQIQTSFRYASGYVAPDIYTGNATLTQIAHTINDTHFTLTYRCQWCLAWNQGGTAGSQLPVTGQALVLGWAQSDTNPSPVTDSDATIIQHDSMGEYGLPVAGAQLSNYSSYISKIPTASPTTSPTSPTSTTTATATATACAAGSFQTAPSTTYDYIIVGAGAGGIPLADRLSEAGHSVLLIEKGPPSSHRWGGTLRPDWLNSTNLTRFDVPGLDNEIWKDSAGIACPDVGVMAGCVLGGGVAINSGLWWYAPDIDWNYNFPTGWQATDMKPNVEKVFSRIPWNDNPSMDGVLHMPEGLDIVGGALGAAGWKNVEANQVPNEKTMTYSRSIWMYSNGERGGPMATYLVTANARKNFKLIMNTAVNRVIRNGSHITGVEVENFLNGGYCGTINVTANTGRVILSAGTYGSPKILFRSGIGPADQLAIVNASSDGPKMINSKQWINLPVGENLGDHTDTDIQITHPNVTFYDYYAAYNTPIQSDAQNYIQHRSGMLAQSAPNIQPIFWDTVVGADKVTRQLQYTARVEGDTNKSMTISQYLGRGAVSRGRLTITPSLDMTPSTLPYLQNADDLAAVITGLERVVKALQTDPNITISVPSTNQTISEYVNADPITTSRTANHWVGTNKMGTDSGLTGGTSVVDTNTKVYGTDNLYVVDASIFPFIGSTNPSALIVAVAERASSLLLAS